MMFIYFKLFLQIAYFLHILNLIIVIPTFAIDNKFDKINFPFLTKFICTLFSSI